MQLPITVDVMHLLTAGALVARSCLQVVDIMVTCTYLCTYLCRHTVALVALSWLQVSDIVEACLRLPTAVHVILYDTFPQRCHPCCLFFLAGCRHRGGLYLPTNVDVIPLLNQLPPLLLCLGCGKQTPRWAAPTYDVIRLPLLLCLARRLQTLWWLACGYVQLFTSYLMTFVLTAATLVALSWPQVADIVVACTYLAVKMQPFAAIIVFFTVASYIPLTVSLGYDGAQGKVLG